MMEIAISEGEAEMRASWAGSDHCLKAFGIDEIDTVVAAEGSAFDLEPVVILVGVAFFCVDDHRLAVCRQFAVGHQVHAVVPDKPKSGPLTLAGFKTVIGIAKTTVCPGIGTTTGDDVKDGLDKEGQHCRSSLKRLSGGAVLRPGTSRASQRLRVTVAWDPGRHRWRLPE